MSAVAQIVADPGHLSVVLILAYGVAVLILRGRP